MENETIPGSPVSRTLHRATPSLSSVKSPRSSSRLSMSSRQSQSYFREGDRASSTKDEDTKTSVKVAVRVRPPLGPTDPGYDLIPQRFRGSTCEVPTPNQLLVQSPQGKKLFVFDRVFDEETTQEGVWDYLCDSVNSFVQGYNVSILAYGQSGAGKSHTMGTGGLDQDNPSAAGVIARAAAALFEKLSSASPGTPSGLPKSGMTGLRSPQRYSMQSPSRPTAASSDTGKSWQLRATYVEIYNEQLRDLLVPESVAPGDRAQVSIREDTKGRIILTGLTQLPINSMEDLLNALDFGSTIRQTDSTAINAKSSRSHAVFTLNLVQKKAGAAAATTTPTTPREKRMSMPVESMLHGGGGGESSTVTTDSKLHFVDLAGSERLKNTGAQGERAKEGISINAGLASLGKVISQLSSRHPGHVSYRDSRLTRLLQDSLGGNAITYMVACVTPAEFHLSETLNTVHYAQRARAIQSKPEIQQQSSVHDEKDSAARMERLQAEVAFLREQIKRNDDRAAAAATADDRPGAGKREAELQNQLMDVQESYNALSQRHAKLIAEMSKARGDGDGDGAEESPTLKDAMGESAMERLKRSNSLSEAVEQVVMEYEKTIQSLESSLSNTRSTLSTSEETLMERESKIAYMESVAQQLQARLQKLAEREDNNDAYLHELETQIEGATSSEEKSASLVASLRKELTRVKESESSAEEYISTLEERLAEAEQDQEIMQREIDRLQNVVERQRSIGRLDNLLAELDTIRANDDAAPLKRSNGHTEEGNTLDDPFREQQSASGSGSTENDDDASDVHTTNAGVVEKPIKDNEATDATTHVAAVEQTKAAPSPRHMAQSQFMADKLENLTQELFDLRSEHESTVADYDDLQRKYEIALQTLAKVHETQTEGSSADTTRPPSNDGEERDSFLGDAGLNGIKEEEATDNVPTSSSRSLESELSSLRHSRGTSIGESIETNGTATPASEAGTTAGAGSNRNKDVEPSSVRLPEETDDEVLALELDSLRNLHTEQENKLRELTESHAELEQQHKAAIGQVEELRTEIQRLQSLSHPPSPGFKKPVVRRRSSQDMLAALTNSDRATRAVTSLRNIALENLNKDPDVRQNFDLQLSTVISELHNRNERLQALDMDVASVRKELETKQQMLAGLTRERTSLQASTPADFTLVGQMQARLEASEQQIRELTNAHAEKEKELKHKVSDLRQRLKDELLSSAVRMESDETWAEAEAELKAQAIAEEQARAAAEKRSTPTIIEPQQVEHVARLEQELAAWETKHREAIESMKASEAGLLTTIAGLEAWKAEHETREARGTTSDLPGPHGELIDSLRSQIDQYKAASDDHHDKYSRLEQSYSSILAHVEEDNRTKELTDKELKFHRELVISLQEQLDVQKTAIDLHEKTLTDLKTTHATELKTLQEQNDLLARDIGRKQDDLEELLGTASTLLGHDTDVGRFHGHLSDALDKNGNNKDARSQLEESLARVATLETSIGELKVLNEEMAASLDKVSDKEKKSSRLVQELEEQLNSTYDQHQATNNRLSTLQSERQMQLEEAIHARGELEKEVEDARLKISLLESQITELRRRSIASTSRDSFNRDSRQSDFRDSLSPEAAAIALARTSTSGSGATSQPGHRSSANSAATALPSPPPAIPLPPLPGSPVLGGASSPPLPSSIDARTTSPPPPGTPPQIHPGRGSQQYAQPGPDPALAAIVEEQESRIRTIEKHLFAEKQLTATLEEALVDLENSQNRTKADLDAWRRKAQGLEDELVGLRKERNNSRASLQQVEEEREMRVRAERARQALEERMRELNAAGGGKKKKKGALNCF